MLCLLPASQMQAADSPEKPKTRELIVSPPSPANQPDIASALVVLGMRNTLNRIVEKAVNDEFRNIHIELVDSRDAALASFDWPTVDIVFATGRGGCELALKNPAKTPVRCTLITEQGFRKLLAEIPNFNNRHLSALVVDQPLARQTRIARRIYPALSRFSVLSSSDSLTASSDDSSAIGLYSFNASVPLHAQVSDALWAHDALIAISDGEVFNRSTLQTVLLTAYGYGKPVIGFSRAYVKAGALITGYSTPEQIIRQLANVSESGTWRSGSKAWNTSEALVVYPKYFSVLDNASVARSLGLVKDFDFVPGHSYVDADFR